MNHNTKITISSLFGLMTNLATTPLHPQWLANKTHLKHRIDLNKFNNKKILDIGSGNINLRNFFTSNNQITRLDYPSTSCRYKLKPDIYGDAHTLPFKKNSFDIIILFEVLEHIKTPSCALKEIYRVCKPGCLLLISVPFCYPLHDTPHDYLRYSKFGIQTLLNDTEFDIIKVNAILNPICTIIQLTNLTLLSAVQLVDKKSNILALVLALIVYPLCLINNCIALPFLWIQWNGPLTLGYYAEAIASKPTNSA